MDVALPLAIVDGLAIIVIGWILVRMDQRILQLEAENRNLLLCVKTLTNNFDGLAQSTLRLVRRAK